MVKICKDGRTILTGKDYTAFRLYMWERQDRRCQTCGWLTDISLPPEAERSFHVHHRNGRGLGGGKRDDTWESCQGDCGVCHRKSHNQSYSKAKLVWSKT